MSLIEATSATKGYATSILGGNSGGVGTSDASSVRLRREESLETALANNSLHVAAAQGSNL